MNPLRADVGWLISGDSGSELGLREVNLNLLAYALEPLHRVVNYFEMQGAIKLSWSLPCLEP